MTWRGEVWTAKSDSVTMDVNNFGIDDLSVDFEKLFFKSAENVSGELVRVHVYQFS